MRLRFILQLSLLLALAACATRPDTQVDEDDYRVYRGDGTPATLEALQAAARAAEVTFLGESHDDPVAHFLEASLLRGTSEPGLALSLEMFETDVQLVLDEYLAGLITEQRFLEDSRPWGNYEDAYRPLVEFAREEGLPVLAANAPRRYVNLVGREGREALTQLSEAAQRFLPPLPPADPSPAYRDKFVRLMTQDMPSHQAPGEEVLERSLQAQSLWDATMAWSLARHLEAHEGSRLLHVNGSFHSEGGLGVVEHLERYRPGTRTVVITVQPSESFPAFDAQEMEGLGDFVVVTPARR